MSVLAHRRKAFQGGGGGGFVPTDIAGLRIWCDVDVDVQKSGGGAPSNGDTLTAWLDQSGNSANPSTLTSLVYNTAPSRITFTGSSRLIWGTNPCAGDASVTVFAVINIPTTETSGILLTGSTSAAYLPYWSSGSGSSASSAGSGTPAFQVNGSSLSSPTRGDIYTNVCVGTPVILVMSACNWSTSGYWNSLGVNNYGGFYFDGSMSDFLVYDSTLSGGDITSVKGYLAAKRGISI